MQTDPIIYNTTEAQRRPWTYHQNLVSSTAKLEELQNLSTERARALHLMSPMTKIVSPAVGAPEKSV